MYDLVSRQAEIDAIVNITNSENASALHGYVKKHGLEELWSGGVSDALAVVENLSSAQPENQVHLCDSCRHVFPECPSEKDDVIFGNGKGNDNICACNKYEPTAQPEPQWIPFVLRPATDEEKEENPDLDYYLDGKLPKNGQKILITVRVSGHEEVQFDEFYSDFDGSYLDGQYEIGTEAVAWMSLPKPYEEEKK